MTFLGCCGDDIRVSVESISYMNNFTYKFEILGFTQQVSKLHSTIIPNHLISYYILTSRKTLYHRMRIDRPSINRPIDSSVHPFIHLFIHSFSSYSATYLSTPSFIDPFNRSTIHRFVHLSINSSIHLSNHPYIYSVQFSLLGIPKTLTK